MTEDTEPRLSAMPGLIPDPRRPALSRITS